MATAATAPDFDFLFLGAVFWAVLGIHIGINSSGRKGRSPCVNPMIERKAAHPPEFYFRSRSIDPEKRCSTHFVAIVHGPANHHGPPNPTPQTVPPRSAQAVASATCCCCSF